MYVYDHWWISINPKEEQHNYLLVSSTNNLLYSTGDSTCGQRALYQIGMTGIPVFNVNNNCSTGSSALMLAKQFIESGSDCTLAFGFEKMEKGSLGAKVE